MSRLAATQQIEWVAIRKSLEITARLIGKNIATSNGEKIARNEKLTEFFASG